MRTHIAGQFGGVGGADDVGSVRHRVVVVKLLFASSVADLGSAAAVLVQNENKSKGGKRNEAENIYIKPKIGQNVYLSDVRHINLNI